jgi:flagellar protein FlgJ
MQVSSKTPRIEGSASGREPKQAAREPSGAEAASPGTPDPALAARVDDAARMYEKQFLREMVKAMRAASSAVEASKPGMAEGLYREQLDDQYVEAWGDQGGLGFHQIIYDQLMGMLSPSQAAGMRPRGPIALTDRDVLRSARAASPGTPLGPSPAGSAPLGGSIRVDLAPQLPGAAPSALAAPWDGKIASVGRDGERTAISIEHAGGARSTLVFDGSPAASAQPGSRVSAGDRVGLLSPEARAFFVRVQALDFRPATP